MNSVSVVVQEATTKDLSALVALAMEVQQLHATVQLSSWAFNTQAHEFFGAQGFAPMSITFEQRLD